MDLAGVDSEGVPRQAAAATLTRVARFPQSPMLRVVLPVTKVLFEHQRIMLQANPRRGADVLLSSHLAYRSDARRRCT